MSLTSIAQSDRGKLLVSGAPPAGPPSVPDWVGRITKFIPGDILTIFLACISAIHGANPNITAKCSPASVVASSISLTSAQDLASWVFWACLGLTPLYVFGMRYLSTKAGDPFIWPIWGAIAGMAAFWIYATMIGDVLLRCPTVVTTLFLIFIAPLLFFINELIAKSIPSQAV